MFNQRRPNRRCFILQTAAAAGMVKLGLDGDAALAQMNQPPTPACNDGDD